MKEGIGIFIGYCILMVLLIGNVSDGKKYNYINPVKTDSIIMRY